MNAWAAFVEAGRRDVAAALERVLDRPGAPPRLIEAMRYGLLGGKRLRALLVLGTAETVAAHLDRPGPEARALALPAACAVEMLHAYSLVHDDLPAMDNDTLRRGRPALHVAHGEGLAILAGDALQAEAFRLLAEEPPSDDPSIAARKIEVIRLVADAAGPAGMVGGQAIDLAAAAPGAPPLAPDQLEAMHARKTGALIRAAAMAGAVMAGGAPDVVAAVGRYAEAVGLAFQIVDDILDVEGDAAGLGKTAGKDAAASKPTYPAIHGLEPSRLMATACLARAEAALAEAGLPAFPLRDIARWIGERRS